MGNNQAKPEVGGFALIIHNDTFDPKNQLAHREGNTKDVFHVKRTLDALKFKYEEASNCTAIDIKNFINNACTDPKYGTYSCLVVVVMTHGSYGGRLYASDTYYNTSDIWSPIAASQNFLDKPKLMFFQACRGDEKEGMSGNTETASSRSCQPFVENSSTENIDRRMPLLPHDYHFFLSFSSVEDKFSMRSTSDGSWYIQAVCNIVENSSETESDLISVMTKVAHDIVNARTQGVAQTPSYISFLPYTISFKISNSKQTVTAVTEPSPGSNSLKRKLTEEDSGTSSSYSLQEFENNYTDLQHDGQMVTEKGNELKYYPSHYDWRRSDAGICLVFYDDMHEQIAQRMGEVFEMMTLNLTSIKISNNNIVTKLEEVAQDLSSLNVNETPDSLVVVILAKLHSNDESQIQAQYEDSHVAYDTCISDSWSPFIASKCTALRERPKLFFYLYNRNVKDCDTPLVEMNARNESPRTNDHQDFFFVYGYGEEFISFLLESIRDGYKKLEVDAIVTRALHQAKLKLDKKIIAPLKSSKLSYFKSTLCLRLIFGCTKNINQENHKSSSSKAGMSSDGCFGFIKRPKKLTKAEACTVDNYGNTPLHLAVRNRNLEDVKYLMYLQVDVHCKNSDGYTPIYIAVKNDDLEMVKCLVEHGADVNVKLNDGETLLQGACLHGTKAVVKYLLEKGANVDEIRPDGDTALQVASAYGKIDIVKLLVKYGANIHHKKCNDDTTALLMASFCSVVGTYECVQFLIEQGADVNGREIRGYTPLQLAVRKSRMDKIKYLVDNGADVHAKSSDGGNIFQTAVEYTNDTTLLDYLFSLEVDIYNIRVDGATSLHIAAHFGKTDNLKWLLEKGCDINAAKFDGKTSLHFAIERGHLECVKILIERGAQIDRKTLTGDTVMHFAVESGKIELCKYLVELGANIHDINCKEWSPLHKAAERGSVEIVKWLLELGANANSNK